MKIDVSGRTTSARLRLLAEILERAPDEQFDMNRWAVGVSAPPTRAELEGGVCGTSACALGWAAACFEGLELESATAGARRNWCFVHRPGFSDFSSFQAGAEFFGISMRDAEYLFDPQNYQAPDACPCCVVDDASPVTRDEVIERLHEMAEKYEECEDENV